MAMRRCRKALAVAGLVVLLAATAAPGANGSDFDEKDVLVLDASNFDAVVKQHASILVEFYAPWCGHCQSLAPHWARAATMLKETQPAVTLAKLDADEHRDIAERFGVKGYPTIKWFSEGVPNDFEGGHTDSEIVAYVTKRMSPPCVVLNTTEEFENFKSSAEVVVVAFLDGAEGEAWGAYESAARMSDDLLFAVTHEKAVYAAANYSRGDIVMFKRHAKETPREAVVLSDKGARTSAKDLNKWIKINRLPLVTTFSPATAHMIFDAPISTQALLFLPALTTSDSAAALEAFQQLAVDYRGTIVAAKVVHGGSSMATFEYFGVKEDETPCLYLVAVNDKRDLTKFKGPGGSELKESPKEAMGEFVTQYFDGKLAAHRRSEPAPVHARDEHGVYTLVGDTFEKMIDDTSKDILIMFYAPWCGHCRALAPTYDKFAASMKQVNSVVIAKMDATANDASDDVALSGFPTILFWKAGRTDRAHLRFNGDRTVKGFRRYVKTHAGSQFELPSQKRMVSAEL